MSAHPNNSGGICLSFSLDFKFMTVPKKNIEDVGTLNVYFHVIHNKRHNILSVSQD